MCGTRKLFNQVVELYVEPAGARKPAAKAAAAGAAATVFFGVHDLRIAGVTAIYFTFRFIILLGA